MWWLVKDDPVIEGATLGDAANLAEIHADCFTHRWSTEDFIKLLENENVRAVHCRRPATWLSPTSAKPRGFVLTRVAADEAEILTIAVAKDARGYGLGKALMRSIMGDLYADRIPNLFLEVDETNEAAVSLYKSLGFRQVGKREAYYRPVDRDDGEAPTRPRALVMRCELR